MTSPPAEPDLMPLQPWFTSLNELLIAHQHLWKRNPFQGPEQYAAALTDSQIQTLETLRTDQAEKLQADDRLLFDYLGDAFPFAKAIKQLLDILPPAPTDSEVQAPLQEKYLTHVPGRKQEQIRYFAQMLSPIQQPMLDWCAGKAHLGRSLHRLCGHPVTALEFDPELVRQGQQLAAGMPIKWFCTDVMTPLPDGCLQPDQHSIALHACGDLHHRFLQVSATHRLERVSLAPCCYPKTQHTTYRPLSNLAQQHGMMLSREDLKLAVRAPVTLSSAENNRRKHMQAWRLGFDLLQREVRDCADYLPVPSLPTSVLTQPFSEFCAALAATKNLPLPTGIDFDFYEEAGLARYEQVTRLDLVSSLFRRALELWLVLDLAMYLQENGYAVTVQQFCPATITPRNLCIDARRKGEA
jgi:hypothetical protein